VSTVTGSRLSQIDLSYNPLGSVGIELFLKCANPSVVTDLDLTATVTDHRSALVYKHLYNYATQVPLYALQNNVCFGLPLENNTFVFVL